MYGERRRAASTGSASRRRSTTLKRERGRRARRRARRRTTCASSIERFRGDLPRGDRRRVPAGSARAARRARSAPSSTPGTRRARSTGALNDIPDDLGTAVNVVQMVFGNKGEGSGTGVAFTRDPSTGEPGPTASSSPTRRARTSSPASARRSRLERDGASGCPRRTPSCSRRCARSRATTATCRTSSSRSRRARSSCSRRAPRSAPPQAALRFAVDMVAEGLLDTRRGGR